MLSRPTISVTLQVQGFPKETPVSYGKYSLSTQWWLFFSRSLSLCLWCSYWVCFLYAISTKTTTIWNLGLYRVRNIDNIPQFRSLSPYPLFLRSLLYLHWHFPSHTHVHGLSQHTNCSMLSHRLFISTCWECSLKILSFSEKNNNDIFLWKPFLLH